MGLAEHEGEPFTMEMNDIREAIAGRGVTFVPASGHEM